MCPPTTGAPHNALSRTPGDLLDAAPWTLSSRTLQPAPERPRRLLVLLHGFGSDEMQLAPLGGSVDGDTMVVLARGPRTVSGGRFGWFREDFADGSPSALVDEVEQARAKLVAFVGQLQHRHDVTAGHTVLAGFSQGGALAAAVALTAPECIAGFSVLCGRILSQHQRRLPPARALARLRALLVHGRQDRTLPLRWPRAAAALLHEQGMQVDLRLHAGGHRLLPCMEADFAAWMGATDKPWNAPATDARTDNCAGTGAGADTRAGTGTGTDAQPGIDTESGIDAE